MRPDTVTSTWRWWCDVLVLVLITAVLWVLVWTAPPAESATLSTATGTLASAQATTGASANIVHLAEDRESIWFDITETGTTTVAIEHSSDGTNWCVVADGVTKLSFADTTNVAVVVHGPAGLYRTNATTCSGCSLTVTYRMGPLAQP